MEFVRLKRPNTCKHQSLSRPNTEQPIALYSHSLQLNLDSSYNISTHIETQNQSLTQPNETSINHKGPSSNGHESFNRDSTTSNESEMSIPPGPSLQLNRVSLENTDAYVFNADEINRNSSNMSEDRTENCNANAIKPEQIETDFTQAEETDDISQNLTSCGKPIKIVSIEIEYNTNEVLNSTDFEKLNNSCDNAVLDENGRTEDIETDKLKREVSNRKIPEIKFENDTDTEASECPNVDSTVDEISDVKIKKEVNIEDVLRELNEMDNFTATIIDIEDPFLVIEVSSESSSDDEE
jgi:hypothetical protein